MKRAALAILLIALASPAMAIDFSTKILDLKNQPIPLCSKEKPDCGVVLTMDDVALTALQAQFPDEQNLAATEKVKRYALGLKINASKGDVHLDAEDVTLLKQLIGKAYGSLVVGRAYEILDPVK